MEPHARRTIELRRRRGDDGAHTALAVRALFAVLAALAMLLLAPVTARAGGTRLPLPLTVVQVSDTALTLDSNSPTTGPRAQYVAYRITNTSPLAVSNLSATIAGFAGGITLQSGQSATQYVGTLAAGASETLFWFVSYPATYNVRQVLTVTVTDGAGNSAAGAGAVRTVSMISAEAGGLASTSSIGAGAVIGQLIPLTVGFRFKGWKAGDTFNLQPAGNTAFDAGCFQMVSSIIVTADAPLSTVIPPGTADRQFFRATVASSGGGSQWNVSIRYMFRYLCAGATTTPLPYSNMLSGTQLKYSASYGVGGGDPGPIPPAPSPSASFAVGKAASPAQLANGGTVTYTVTVRNTSTFDVTIDSIQDVLPAGATYVGLAAGSGVTTANSGSVPAFGASGTIVFRASSPGVTYAIAAGDSLRLIYTVLLPAAAGQYVNGASSYVGSTLIGSASATVAVGSADLSVSKSGPGSVIAGDTALYVITTSNAGPTAAFNVVVRDSLPPGMTFVRGSRGATASGGVVTWPAAASLAANASLTDTVVALAPAALGSVVNVALASATTSDPSATNNDGSNAAARPAVAVTMPVRVTPDGIAAPLARLAGAGYAQPFAVENLGPVGATYALVAAARGTAVFLAIDSITGPGVVQTPQPDSARITLAARATGTYPVWYSVPVGDTAQNTERLVARNVAAAAYHDSGWVDVRREFPTLTIAKSASVAAVQPGAEVTYTVQFSNAGGFAADSVVVTDQVPAEVMLKLGSLGQTIAGGLPTTVAYSSDAGATWLYAPSSGGCGAPAGFDACVNRIRWTLVGTLAAASPQSTVTFVARVR